MSIYFFPLLLEHVYYMHDCGTICLLFIIYLSHLSLFALDVQKKNQYVSRVWMEVHHIALGGNWGFGGGNPPNH